MTCPNCDPALDEPGKLKHVTKELLNGIHCALCGDAIAETANQKRWDIYFHSICIAVASKSPCLSRKIGAILVRDKSIISTGYNGPPRGVAHCGHERMMKDDILSDALVLYAEFKTSDVKDTCPRRLLGHSSGEGMQWCPAQHAEENCISNAARNGVSTLNTTLYMNCIIPCKNCFGTLINAGISEIVVDDTTTYDKHTQYIIEQSNIKIRKFNL